MRLRKQMSLSCRPCTWGPHQQGAAPGSVLVMRDFRPHGPPESESAVLTSLKGDLKHVEVRDVLSQITSGVVTPQNRVSVNPQ